MFKFILLAVVSSALSACAVVSVAGAAVSVAATAVKTTAKVAGAAVDLAIPDKKDRSQETDIEPTP